jgi:sigma-54 dependent transcriptional regulator, acetoin dehydrogenase operon transcriptional activator AcoR
MMNSVLKQIQDTVIKYAEIISNVLRVEVEIVDENLIRIAGTGVYKDKVNQDISKEGYVYSHVLHTGEQQIIEDPGKHELCKNCKKSDCCEETMEICIPIKLGEDIIGVIGLLCLNEKQRKHLRNNMDTYLQFLFQIADFISTKVYENNESERSQRTLSIFRQIIDSINKGVLVINNKNEIIHINEAASKYLRISQSHLNRTIEITGTNEYILGGEIYSVKLEGKKMEFLGQVIPVFPLFSPYDKIFIFSELKKGKQESSSSTYVWQTVKLEDIEGKSKPMLQVKEKIKKIAASKSTVLITGESGTGKEMIARAIHAESDRWNKPFIAINCGAIPDTLLESELFGYVRGAFSGADPGGRIGKFELANKGVIFLDEIGDMPLYLQVKILRVLQERKLARIGSNQMVDLDIRVIAATNKDLKKYISENKFREDLYYRLNVIPIELPPLRERKEDIEVILLKMIEKYNALFKTDIEGIDEETKKLLINYSWPGNVRELENVVEFMMNMSEGNAILNKSTIPEGILNYKRDETEIEKNIDYEEDEESIRPLKEIEKEYILRALKLYGSDTKGKQLAAKKLGIGIATLYRKLEEFQLSK